MSGPLFVIATTFIVIVAAFIWFLARLRLHGELLKRGKRTMATVTDASALTLRDIPSNRHSRRTTTYHYTLEYTVEGERLTGKETTTSPLCGNTVEIAYLPENPRRFLLAEHISDTPENKFNIAFSIVVLVGILIALAYVFHALL